MRIRGSNNDNFSTELWWFDRIYYLFFKKSVGSYKTFSFRNKETNNSIHITFWPPNTNLNKLIDCNSATSNYAASHKLGHQDCTWRFAPRRPDPPWNPSTSKIWGGMPWNIKDGLIQQILPPSAFSLVISLFAPLGTLPWRRFH